MPCSRREVEVFSNATREGGDFVIDDFSTHWFGAPAGLPAKARAVLAFQTFIYFLQDNGLTRRTILKPGEQPSASTQIWASDLTDEGNRLMEAAHMKWISSLDIEERPTDISILVKALGRIRDLDNRRAGARRSAPSRLASRQRVPAAKRKQQIRADEHPAGKAEKLEGELEDAPHVYDKAKWHYEGDYPKGLPKGQAFVHTGFFAGWLMDHDMLGEDFLPEAKLFKRKEITGPQAYEIWDGGLDSNMLTPQGNEFARDYYDSTFTQDYEELLVRKLPSFYHVKDTWANYRILKRRINARYTAWRKAQRGKRKADNRRP
jgi:hypothetical protein